MDWTIDNDETPDFIPVKLSGRFRKDHFEDMINGLVGKDYFEAGSRILFDVTHLDNMSDRDLIEAGNAFIVQNKALAFSKMAIVTAPKDLHAGRKFEKLMKYSSRAIMQIFDDRNIAVQWLAGIVVSGPLIS